MPVVQAHDAIRTFAFKNFVGPYTSQDRYGFDDAEGGGVEPSEKPWF